MMKRFLVILVVILLGVGVGIGGMLAIARAPLRFDHPIYKLLGIQKPQIVGFLPYWLLDKADKEYSAYLTTLAYFSVTLNGDGTLMTLVNAQEEEPGWTTLKGEKLAAHLARANAQGLKKSLLIFASEDDVVQELLKDPEGSAKTLVSSVAPIMREHGFTDLNLDIETFMEASESARQQFTTFVQTVKHQMDEESLGTLTLDVIPISFVKPHLVDARVLGAIADSIVLMTYDYHYLGSFVTGPIAPVGGGRELYEYDVETAIQVALSFIPKEKILLGVPLYGYQWETIGPRPGEATIPGGGATASTRRITDILENCATCSATIDPISKEPSLIYPEHSYFKQTFYENETSMKEKVALAQKYQLGGIALWALGYEDDTMLRPLGEYKSSVWWVQ